MSDIKAAYKEVALAVWQLCAEQNPEELAQLKPEARIKSKGKKSKEQKSK